MRAHARVAVLAVTKGTSLALYVRVCACEYVSDYVCMHVYACVCVRVCVQSFSCAVESIRLLNIALKSTQDNVDKALTLFSTVGHTSVLADVHTHTH